MRGARCHARNRLALEAVPARTTNGVAHDIEFTVVTEVTRRRADDPALSVGKEVTAAFNVSAVHLVLRP